MVVVVMVVVIVMVAFMPVLDAAVRLSLNRIRLGIAFDNVCGTQRFAFQAHRAEQTSHIRIAEEPIRIQNPKPTANSPPWGDSRPQLTAVCRRLPSGNPDSASLPRVYLVSW